MKIISNLFYFSLTLLIFILNFASYSNAIGNVDWILLKENDDGKEWLDKGSIKLFTNGEISVLTKFFKNPTNSDDDRKRFEERQKQIDRSKVENHKIYKD